MATIDEIVLSSVSLLQTATSLIGLMAGVSPGASWRSSSLLA